MNTVLLILVVLGLGAVVISAYVFTVAARNYVSTNDRRYHRNVARLPHQYVTRNPVDRRSGRPVTFPLTVNGILIAHDRRNEFERRAA